MSMPRPRFDLFQLHRNIPTGIKRVLTLPPKLGSSDALAHNEEEVVFTAQLCFERIKILFRSFDMENVYREIYGNRGGAWEP
jgi:hypothetical protein